MGRWLAGAGGAATAGEIGAAFVLNRARQADVLNHLRDARLTERDGRVVRLTPAGWARFSGLGPGDAGAVLDRVLGDDWPAQHRALVELVVSAVIARHHLGAARPEPHLGFIAIGETATGKSSTGEVVCHLFGFDPVTSTVHVPAETPGSVLGRREAVEGAEGDRWRFVPGPATRMPFVLLDEFDKADVATRRSVWPYLDGRLRVQVEGQVHELLPTPLLAANPPTKGGDRYTDLRSEYRRRAVVLDTGFMRGRGRELERLLRIFYEQSRPADRLALDRLVPPPTLHSDARAVLDTLADSLTEDGQTEFPGARALELVTLGRCALLGPEADHVAAALQTGIAYLTVTSSVPGQVDPHWALDIAAVREYLGAGGPADQIDAAVQRARRAAVAQHDVARQRQRRARRADLALVEAGAALQSKLERLRTALSGRSLRPESRDRAAGLRKVLRQLAATAGRVTTSTGLQDVAAEAADPIVRARALLDEDVRAREIYARDRRDALEAQRRSIRQAKADAAQLREWQRESERAGRQQASDALAEILAFAKELEPLWWRSTTRPDENPLIVLAALRVDDRPLLTYRQPIKRPPATGLQGFVQAFASTQPQGSWHTAGGGPTFPGTPASCSALSRWGPDTRAVLEPVLAHLHHAEDHLREQLGRPRREKRPAINFPSRALGHQRPAARQPPLPAAV